MLKSLFKAGGVVAFGILLGRLAGFARELLIAHFLGGGPSADAAVFALTLPDVFTNILVGGALGAALIPEFQGAGGAASRPARVLFLQSTLVSLGVFGALAVLVVSCGSLLLRLLAPGIVAGSVPGMGTLVVGSAVVIPLTALAAVSTSYLHAFNRFAVASSATLIFNGLLVGMLAWRVRPDSLEWLAVAMALGAALRWVVQLTACAAVPAAIGAEASPGWRVNRPLVVRYAQALGSSVLLLLVPVVARSLISSSGPGAFAAVNYAFKLSELPLGMLITVFPIVLLPRLSALFGEGKEAEAASLARWGIWMTWILSLPLALAGGWFRRPIIALLFGHGRMTEGTLGFVGDLTAWTMAALPAQGLAVLLFAVLSAKKDTRFIFRASVVGFLAFLPAAWAARVLLGPAGLMAAVVVLHWGIALSYGWALSRRHGMALLCDGLRRDLLLSALVVAAGFLPVALVPVRSFGAATGAGLAAAGSATALLALLILPRTRAALKALP